MILKIAVTAAAITFATQARATTYTCYASVIRATDDQMYSVTASFEARSDAENNLPPVGSNYPSPQPIPIAQNITREWYDWLNANGYRVIYGNTATNVMCTRKEFEAFFFQRRGNYVPRWLTLNWAPRSAIAQRGPSITQRNQGGAQVRTPEQKKKVPWRVATQCVKFAHRRIKGEFGSSFTNICPYPVFGSFCYVGASASSSANAISCERNSMGGVGPIGFQKTEGVTSAVGAREIRYVFCEWVGSPIQPQYRDHRIHYKGCGVRSE